MTLRPSDDAIGLSLRRITALPERQNRVLCCRAKAVTHSQIGMCPLP
jgi:hypothetical protein